MNSSDGSLADQAAKATQWRLASALLSAVARLGIGVLLARLLPPVDFGILALALIVTGFAQPLGDLGIASAVVQRRDLTPRHIRAAFTFSVVMGVLIASVLILGAPLAALLVRDARVTPVLRVLSITFAIQGFSVVAAGLLRRRLDFRRMFFIETASYVLGYGLVAVTCAIAGLGVWSLVWGSLVQTILSATWQVISARHAMKLLFAGRELGELLHYGIGAGGISIVNYLALNADNFLVGRLLGATSLGLYSRAYNLMNLPYFYAASVMSGVLFPAFAQIQSDIPRLRRGYLTMTKLTAFVAGPSMCALAIAAPFLVPALYGRQWVRVVAPLQILCAAGYFRALYHVGGIVAQSVGRVYSELWLQIGYAILVVIGAIVGSAFALPGVAVGVGIAIVYMFLVTGRLVLSITETSWVDYLRAQRDAIVTSAAVAGFALAAQITLEQAHARTAVTAVGVLAAAAIPWAAGLLWNLGEPDLAPVALRLPEVLQQLVRFTRRFSTISANFRA
jgi:O-antigen/teichoic acid export membrane protein